MNNTLNQDENRLMELMESKSFDALSKSDKSLVLKHMSMKDYELQRSIIVSSSVLNDEIVPVPLILPQNKGGIVIPLYQALVAVAAAVVISFFIFNRTEIIREDAKQVNVAVAADTVFVDQIQLDTIIEYQTRIVRQQVGCELAEQRPPENHAPTIHIPMINESDIDSKSVGISNDPTFELVQGINIPNSDGFGLR